MKKENIRDHVLEAGLALLEELKTRIPGRYFSLMVNGRTVWFTRSRNMPFQVLGELPVNTSLDEAEGVAYVIETAMESDGFEWFKPSPFHYTKRRPGPKVKNPERNARNVQRNLA
jgi:hypothetical protein